MHACTKGFAILMNCSSSRAAREVVLRIQPAVMQKGKEAETYDCISTITIVAQQKAADQ